MEQSTTQSKEKLISKAKATIIQSCTFCPAEPVSAAGDNSVQPSTHSNRTLALYSDDDNETVYSTDKSGKITAGTCSGLITSVFSESYFHPNETFQWCSCWYHQRRYSGFQMCLFIKAPPYNANFFYYNQFNIIFFYCYLLNFQNFWPDEGVQKKSCILQRKWHVGTLNQHSTSNKHL